MDFTKELEPFICDRIGEVSHNLVQSGSDSDLDRLYKYLSILTIRIEDLKDEGPTQSN